MHAKKLIRTALFAMPRVYDLIGGQGRYLLMHRLGMVHEADFRRLSELVAKPSPVVIDVGANIGQSILSTLTVLPDADVISFEPNPDNFPALERLALRHSGVRIERCGLGDQRGQMTLYWPCYNGKSMPTLASLDLAWAANWVAPRNVYRFNPKKLEVRSATVPVHLLDDFDLSPDLIKIDVEGRETEVIRGGLRMIERHRPLIMAECIRPDTIALVSPLGYRHHRFGGPGGNSFLLPS